MRRPASPPRGDEPVVVSALQGGFAGAAVEPATPDCARRADRPVLLTALFTAHLHRTAPR